MGDSYIYKNQKKLRWGYTTGTCAAAASLAAAVMLLRDLAVVQVDPDNRGHDAGDGVGQEVAQTETGDMLDHERVDDDGQRQCGDDHDRHLNQGVDQHPADAGPEVAGSNSILEVLESGLGQA